MHIYVGSNVEKFFSMFATHVTSDLVQFLLFPSIRTKPKHEMEANSELNSIWHTSYGVM
jgi:hypothetical protein